MSNQRRGLTIAELAEMTYLERLEYEDEMEKLVAEVAQPAPPPNAQRRYQVSEKLEPLRIAELPAPRRARK